jgi:hypothetical protein
MTVDIMTVNEFIEIEMTVNELIENEMTLYGMLVDEMPLDKNDIPPFVKENVKSSTSPLPHSKSLPKILLW